MEVFSEYTSADHFQGWGQFNSELELELRIFEKPELKLELIFL